MPETVIGYRVVAVVGGTMRSLFACQTSCFEYLPGKRVAYPPGGPSVIFRDLADAQAYSAHVLRWADSATRVIKVRGEVAPEGHRPYVPDHRAPGEKIWCSAITPLAVVNADGTEEGAEHRVVEFREDGDDWMKLYLGDTFLACVFANRGIEPGTYTLSGPSPEPERVELISIAVWDELKCSKCEHQWQQLREDPPDPTAGKCMYCGVLFAKEDPDA